MDLNKKQMQMSELPEWLQKLWQISPMLARQAENDYINLKKQLTIPAGSNLLCGSFEPDNKTSSATKCKCGREKWEHPKVT